MTGTPDISPIRIEGEKLLEYTPAKDLRMRRVIIRQVINQQGEDTELGSIGYTTDIRGAKVPLEQLGHYNKTTANVHATPSSGGEPPYKVGYFKTHTGAIYQFRNLEDGTWVVESTKSPMQLNINGRCIIEVGQPFKIPTPVEGKAELDTSPVVEVTLKNTSHASGITRYHGIPYSQEASDIAKVYHQQKNNPNNQIQGK